MIVGASVSQWTSGRSSPTTASLASQPLTLMYLVWNNISGFQILNENRPNYYFSCYNDNVFCVNNIFTAIINSDTYIEYCGCLIC